jgi:hypothetical protein
MAVGTAFAIVGLTDLALLWWPLGFGDAIWEFGTLSGTLDRVPMPGLGIVLIVYGMLRHPRAHPGWVRGAAGVFAVAACLLVVSGLIYGTAAPEVLRHTPPEAVDALKRALVKGVVQLFVYTVAFALIALALWRGVYRRSGTPDRT